MKATMRRYIKRLQVNCTKLFSFFAYFEENSIRWTKYHRIFLISFLFFYFPCQADLPSETVYLTWKRSPTTTMTIQWISTIDQLENRILYRQKDKTEWIEIRGHASQFPQTLSYLIHQVELLSLKPNTEYVFKFYSQPKEYLFKTMPLTLDESIRFVVGGDMLHDGIEFLCATSKQAALFDPDFAILGGDIAYASSSKPFKGQKIENWIQWVKCWHEYMISPRGYLIPVVSAVGNHDVSGNFDQTPNQARIFCQLFPMPGEQVFNVLDFGSYLTIFLLDSGHANPISGKQTTWLKKELSNRRHFKNRFAVYHVPAYPSVRSYFNPVSRNIRNHWVPHFEAEGIQTAFEHHDHAYKRTHPLLKGRPNPDGVIYLGDGAWGVKKPRISNKKFQKNVYTSFFSPQRHFIGVILHRNQQSFLSINSQGNIIDKCHRLTSTVD